MIAGFLYCWFLLTILSVLYLIYDQVVNTPSKPVMGFAWALVVLYTGPLGLFFYFLSCRQPMPGTHDQFIAAHWKQALGSEIHCVAGDATAIIISALVLAYIRLPNGIEAIIEYVSAYLFGLLIFQALFMRSMFASYWQAVKHTVFAETFSMNLIMTGMIPIVLVFKGLFPESNDPGRIYFWGVMALASIVGSILGYPINSWLVKRGIKHGMMSRPQTGVQKKPAMGKCGAQMEGMPMADDMLKRATPGGHKMGKLPIGIATWTVIWTYILVIAVTWLMAIWVPIRFT